MIETVGRPGTLFCLVLDRVDCRAGAYRDCLDSEVDVMIGYETARDHGTGRRKALATESWNAFG